MINFTEACKIAYDYFADTKKLRGIYSAQELENGWLFWGRDFSDNIPEYGNTPIFVEKAQGALSLFQISDPRNIHVLYNPKIIDVPNKYKIQCR